MALDTLRIMSAPSALERETETDRQAVIAFLQNAVAEHPELTWRELVQGLKAYKAGPINGMDGWLTNVTRAVGKALDVFTFGGASKVLNGTKNLLTEAFSSKKVGDSLKNAADGFGDDMLNSFIDALPFGIGKDLKSGHVLNTFWPLILAVAVIAGYFLFFRKKKRR